MDSVKELSIKDLFSGQDFYTIPSYQRNYAWGYKEIEQLIQDILDQAINNKDNKYYIGTLVTYLRKDGVYEVIDGQQRLTTFNLLISAIKNNDKNDSIDNSDKSKEYFKNLILNFDSRPKSKETLSLIWDSDSAVSGSRSLINGYDHCKKILGDKLKDNSTKIQKEEFFRFLFDEVIIYRVCVPHDTDLNHYFEIMNNRGEQLEKHEILKAKFLEHVGDEKAKYTFATIWDACSNMDRYVQMCFDSKDREKIFGANWNELKCDSFDKISATINVLDNKNEASIQENNILELINNNLAKTLNENKENVENNRFKSVIDFPNFLLHVLRVFVNKNKLICESAVIKECITLQDLPLDDKRLLESFDKIFGEYNQPDITKLFAFEMLRVKFLFDKYVIKREVNKDIDGWELQSLNKYENNKSSNYLNTFEQSSADKEIILLLSMFHVSNPSMNYKYWLDGVMAFLLYPSDTDDECNNEALITADNYISYLRELARKFIFARYLNKVSQDYYQLIYHFDNAHKLNLDNFKINKDSIQSEQVKDNETLLSYGELRNNLIFNYVDYLIWRSDDNESDKMFFGEKFVFSENYSVDKFNKSKDKFAFTFRSSVEHYFSQNQDEATNQKLSNGDLLDSFGNLCLVTHEMNSSLSNNGYITKREKYSKKHDALLKPDSLKQYLMMAYKDWNDNAIIDHHNKMVTLLGNDLKIFQG